MQNRKQFLKDIIKNTLAFGIYMVAFHIFMMPFLAKKLDPEINAQFLLYVMISNIATLSIGNELGILYQVLTGREKGEQTLPDIRYILNFSSVVLSILMFGTMIILRFSLLASLFLSLTVFMTNFRLFMVCYLRLRMNFKAIIAGNFLYFIGVVLSLVFLNYAFLIFWLPIFLAELFSALFYRYSAGDFFLVKPNKTSEFRVVLKEFFELFSSTLLTNIPNYADKIMILPLLGDVMMAAYYAGSVVSNLLFIIINPINGVILAWLSKDNISDAKTIINNHIKVNFIIIALVFCLNIPAIYLMTWILYKKYLHIVITILIPLSINATFSIASSLLKMVYLRYLELKRIKYFNLTQLMCFILFSFIGSKFFGVIGFAFGAAFSKFVLWFLYLYSLFKVKNV
ncbi:MAG TPA: hypothetical protein GXZ43_00830 [Clostridiaceae bacterium]|nr:hypothetical protein [Clostridiaceae bacterium]